MFSIETKSTSGFELRILSISFPDATRARSTGWEVCSFEDDETSIISTWALSPVTDKFPVVPTCRTRHVLHKEQGGRH